MLRNTPFSSPKHKHSNVSNIDLFRSVALFALFLLACFSPASAHSENKGNSIVVLGLEVVGQADKGSTDDANLLTWALRDATALSKHYNYLSEINKDVLELKLLNGCTSESTDCMAKIAKQLDADYIVYGKLEPRRSKRYNIRLTLLSANDKSALNTLSKKVTKDRLSSENLAVLAEELTNRLLVAPLDGALKVITNLEEGRVLLENEAMLDDNIKASLDKGKAIINGLKTGVYQVNISSAGHKPYLADVAIAAGKTKTLNVALKKLDLSSKSRSKKNNTGHSNHWKKAFVGGAVVTGALGAGWGYFGYKNQISAPDTKNQRLVDLQNADNAFDGRYVMGDIANQSTDVLVHDLDASGNSLGQVRRSECTGNYGSNACRVARIDSPCAAARTTVASYESSGGSGNANVDSALRQYVSACNANDNAAKRSTLFAGATVGAAVITAFLFYKGYLSGDNDKSKKRALLLPTFENNQIGAQLSIEF